MHRFWENRNLTWIDFAIQLKNWNQPGKNDFFKFDWTNFEEKPYGLNSTIWFDLKDIYCEIKLITPSVENIVAHARYQYSQETACVPEPKKSISKQIFPRFCIFIFVALNTWLTMSSANQNSRIKSYKNKGLDAEELRRRREEEGVQLRKAKREEQVITNMFTDL